MCRYHVQGLIAFMIITLVNASCAAPSASEMATPTRLPQATFPSPPTRAVPTPPDLPIVTTLVPSVPIADVSSIAPTPLPAQTQLTTTSTPISRQLTSEELIAQTFQHLAEEPLRSSRQLCRPNHPGALYDKESADKRYRAFTYQYETLIFVTCIFDTQSSTFQPAGRGIAVAFEWSPSADYLLVNEQAAGLRTYMINATTGVTVELPVLAVWGPTPYDPNPMGVAPDGAWSPTNSDTGMAWSPDGASIALNTAGFLYLLDTTRLWQKGGKQAIQKVINVSLIGRPRWSADGQFLFGAEVIINPDSALHPSSMYRYQNIRINARTGAIQQL